MSKRVKREGQNIIDWLGELVASDPEAQRAYEDEALRLGLASALQKAREAAGMTQTMVAEEMGVRQSLISKLERPDHNHTIETVLAYLQAVSAGLVVAVVAANGRDLIPASALAEDIVLLPKGVREQAQAAQMSPREYVIGCLAHHQTAQKMTRVFRGELKQHMSELKISFQQTKASPVKPTPTMTTFAQKTRGNLYVEAA